MLGRRARAGEQSGREGQVQPRAQPARQQERLIVATCPESRAVQRDGDEDSVAANG